VQKSLSSGSVQLQNVPDLIPGNYILGARSALSLYPVHKFTQFHFVIDWDVRDLNLYLVLPLRDCHYPFFATDGREPPRDCFIERIRRHGDGVRNPVHIFYRHIA